MHKIVDSKATEKYLSDRLSNCYVLFTYVGFEKDPSHFLQGRRPEYLFIKESREVYYVKKMCEVLNVNSNCFCRLLVSPDSLSEHRSKSLVGKICEAHRDGKYSYCSPRITVELRKKR